MICEPWPIYSSKGMTLDEYEQFIIEKDKEERKTREETFTNYDVVEEYMNDPKWKAKIEEE